MLASRAACLLATTAILAWALPAMAEEFNNSQAGDVV